MGFVNLMRRPSEFIGKLKKNKKKGQRQLSLSSIGQLINRKLIGDVRGHIYIWDPRYNSRQVEYECQQQEIRNAKYFEEKTKNYMTMRGM